MSDFERRVVIIPARPQAMQEELKRQKRVAAYCRYVLSFIKNTQLIKAR